MNLYVRRNVSVLCNFRKITFLYSNIVSLSVEVFIRKSISQRGNALVFENVQHKFNNKADLDGFVA